MSSRTQALKGVSVGDLIFGLRENGRPDLLFVYSADDTALLARNIFNRANFRFGRDGVGQRVEDGQVWTIVSTAEHPPEQRQVAIELDPRMGSNP